MSSSFEMSRLVPSKLQESSLESKINHIESAQRSKSGKKHYVAIRYGSLSSTSPSELRKDKTTNSLEDAYSTKPSDFADTAVYVTDARPQSLRQPPPTDSSSAAGVEGRTGESANAIYHNEGEVPDTPLDQTSCSSTRHPQSGSWEDEKSEKLMGPHQFAKLGHPAVRDKTKTLFPAPEGIWNVSDSSRPAPGLLPSDHPPSCNQIDSSEPPEVTTEQQSSLSKQYQDPVIKFENTRSSNQQGSNCTLRNRRQDQASSSHEIISSGRQSSLSEPPRKTSTRSEDVEVDAAVKFSRSEESGPGTYPRSRNQPLANGKSFHSSNHGEEQTTPDHVEDISEEQSQRKTAPLDELDKQQSKPKKTFSRPSSRYVVNHRFNSVNNPRRGLKRPQNRRRLVRSTLRGGLPIVEPVRPHICPLRPPSARNVRHHLDPSESHIRMVKTNRRYLVELCGALIDCGAPSHRLEDYMEDMASFLVADGEFFYLPGSMMIVWYDPVVPAGQVTLVRAFHSVNLSDFEDVYSIVKSVNSRLYDVEQGLAMLRDLGKKNSRYWQTSQIFAYGIASASVAASVLGAQRNDFIPCFILGSTLGVLQLFSSSVEFALLFEIFIGIITAFAARAFGSIKGHDGGTMFCFSAISQSSIALILPGYTILCAALELRSHRFISGAAGVMRVVYHTLSLGFGLLIGMSIYGMINAAATNQVTCTKKSEEFFRTSAMIKLGGLLMFASSLAVIHNAKLRQMPLMLLIAVCGHQVRYWTVASLTSNMVLADTLCAFVIGSMANIYARFYDGLAAAIILPAVWVLVPSGVAASGMFFSGILSASEIGYSPGDNAGPSALSYQVQAFDTTARSLYMDAFLGMIFALIRVALSMALGFSLSRLLIFPSGEHAIHQLSL